MSVQDFKCPSCGAALAWDSGQQKMKCDHCDNTFDVEALKEYADEREEQPVEEYAWEPYEASGELSGLKSYICNSCGGVITGEETTAATHCPYCDSPVVLDNNVSGLLRPDIVIPFKQNKQAAIDAFARFCRKKAFLPGRFASDNHVEEITGLYVPFWLFDCGVDGKVRFDATKTRHWSDSSYDYTQTDHFMVIREGGAQFEFVPVDGSQKMDDAFMEAIEPFDMSEGVSFETAYLAGYLADKYDVSAEESHPRANQRVKNGLVELMRQTATGYDSVIEESTSIKVTDGRVRYAMFPVWILSTRYKDKLYRFAMNGQTGKFVGNLPMSWGKFFAAFSGITLGVTAIITLIGWLML